MTTPKPALYARTYVCFYDGASFDVSLLRQSARDRFQRLDEYLDLSLFQPPPGGDPTFVDYHLLEVKVCPGCLFASNDAAHFRAPNPYITPFRPEVHHIKHVTDSLPARRELAAGARSLADRGRAPEGALVAFKLAIQSSTSLYQADPVHLGGEIVRAANYGLKAARIAQRLGRADEHATWLTVSHGYFQRALTANLAGMPLYRSLYQLAALSLLLGDKRTVSRCFEQLRKLTRTEPVKEVHAYFNRLRKLWEDREEVAGSNPPAASSPTPGTGPTAPGAR